MSGIRIHRTLSIVLFFAIVTALCGVAGKLLLRAEEPAVVVTTADSATERLLPRLRLLRTLTGPNEHYPWLGMVSGTSHLVWSPDGRRVAAYVRNGQAIMVWSPDGTVEREIPLYSDRGPNSADYLEFLSGHSQILTGPAADGPRNVHTLGDTEFSILDAETGNVIRSVRKLNPGKSFAANVLSKVVISPDQSLAAILTFDSKERWIGIYSTDDWRRVAALPFGEGDDAAMAGALAFSPNGTMIAIAYTNELGENARVDIFDLRMRTLLRTISIFPEPLPRGKPPLKLPQTILLTHLSFNRDSSMIAVACAGGGSWWEYPDGTTAPPGLGKLTDLPIPAPLRVFDVSNGNRVASAAGYPGLSFNGQLIAWSPRQDFIAFVDGLDVMRLWYPLAAGPTVPQRQVESSTTAIAFSPDGRLLSQGFGDGVRLFEIVNTI